MTAWPHKVVFWPLNYDRLATQSLSGRNRTSDPVIADIYSHMLYQLSYAE